MSSERETSTSRRAFLGGTATLAATTALPTAAAQESSTATGAETESGGDGAGMFTMAAIPDDAPTFDGDDYVGLFVHISGPGENKGSEGVESCEFASSSDEELVTWDAILIDENGEDAKEKLTLHAKQGADGMHGGHLFIVNGQSDCGDGYVQVTLEQIGASSVDYTGSVTEGGSGGESNADAPGFGAVAGLSGLLGAGWLAKHRSD